jgi:two-component system, OmpR family, alkaline phosphatase synthesis response regulator PhoP
MQKRALVVEDEKDIHKLITLHLADLNFEVDGAFNGEEGLKKALLNDYDFIVLDIMLPGMDGIEVCKQIRHGNRSTPIMMLTSKSEEIDKVLALETGADDYMTKPFGARELQARVKAILRRVPILDAAQKNQNICEMDGLMVDLGKRIVKKNGETLNLTPKEFDLLSLFIQNPGKTYSRMDLLEQVWNYTYEGYEHTVNSHMNRLRHKVEDDMNNPKFILTTWGVGYRFREK